MTETIRLANESIRLAQEDYNIAIFSDSDIKPKPLNRICNLCQQVVERMLKALSLAIGEEGRHTHDLGLLISDLETTGFFSFEEIIKDYADFLTPFGVKARYPFEIEIDDNDEVSAIIYTKALCKDINSKIEGLKNKDLSLIYIPD